ncbi:hypothetical protein INR49_008025 [Caranx melampygus]|nr:hypothetical protein INR49_008025 [Caranx melampygus]
MALHTILAATLRTVTDLRVNKLRTFATSVVKCRRTPLGPMPNADIDLNNPESMERYRSYTRYLRQAEEAKNRPAWWKTYKGYMEQADPDHVTGHVDIGLPYHRPRRTTEVRERKRVMKDKKKNAELERSLRLRTFKIPMDRVQETWEQSSAPFHIQRLAEHYGVFRDLFPKAYFLPQVLLNVHYGQDISGQVHYGNRLTPTEAALAPQVHFEAEENSMWTLLLTCPGVISMEGQARLEMSCVTTFLRFLQEEQVSTATLSLEDRTFRTQDFYRKYQDDITPAGMAFFQSQWDESVSNTFHNTLNMKEPVFEFIRPPVYHPPQVKYPHRQPLRYLDRYGHGHTYGIY